jgi:hypothetical protein
MSASLTAATVCSWETFHAVVTTNPPNTTTYSTNVLAHTL